MHSYGFKLKVGSICITVNITSSVQNLHLSKLYIRGEDNGQAIPPHTNISDEPAVLLFHETQDRQNFVTVLSIKVNVFLTYFACLSPLGIWADDSTFVTPPPFAFVCRTASPGPSDAHFSFSAFGTTHVTVRRYRRFQVKFGHS